MQRLLLEQSKRNSRTPVRDSTARTGGMPTGVLAGLKLRAHPSRWISFSSLRSRLMLFVLFTVLPAVALAVATAEANHSFVRNLVVLGLIMAVVGATAWFGSDLFILGPVHNLVRATKRLSLGDLSVRAGSSSAQGELEQLAQSFDEMASSLERRDQQLNVLKEIERAVNSTLDLHGVLNTLLEKMNLLLPYAAVTVRLLDRQTGELEPMACSNLNEEQWKTEYRAPKRFHGRGLSKAVLERKKPIVVENVQTDPRTGQAMLFRKYGLVSYLGLPLMTKGEVLGILGLYTKRPHRFSLEEIEFLSTISGQAAIAIHNARLYEDLKKHAEQLRNASKVKSEFLSVVSHELRTPLNVIMGYTGILQEKIPGDLNPQQEKILGKVIDRSKDLLDMINGMLYATTLEANAVKVAGAEVDIRAFLDKLRSEYDLPLEKDVALSWDSAADLGVIKTDPDKLRHILRNLINNAIKFTDKGTVRVSARRNHAGRTVEFKVADTGIGISHESLPFIFDMFRQVDGSETRRYGGVGMGLYIVKRFAGLIEGEVEVQSAPSQGSTFTVTLPCELNRAVA